MSNIQDIINNVLGDRNTDDRRTMDTGVECIDIILDEVLDSFGSPFVYQDIVRPKTGFGDVGFCYTRVVHPVICELFNQAIDSDVHTTKEQIDRILNLRHDNELADFAVKSIENKIWEVVNTTSRHIEVLNKDVAKLCMTMVMNMIGLIKDSALDFAKRVGSTSDINTPFIQIDHRASTVLIPNENPYVLRVVISYGWIHM